MAGTLSQKLIPRLQSRFAGRGLRVHDGKHPAASFPAAHPDVGDLRIDDDGDELTIYVGALSHGHFSPFDMKQPIDAREEFVIAQVIEFLDDVFADRIEFWTDGDRMGGWNDRDQPNILGQRNGKRYVWSGPLPPPHMSSRNSP